MKILFLIPIFIGGIFLIKGLSGDTDDLPEKTEVINHFLVSEDGYRINVMYIKGFKTVETWPKTYVVTAYITGACSYPIKSGFTTRQQGNEWLDSFLENHMQDILSKKE